MLQRGYTSIELMIVVAIIAILAGVSIPQYLDHVSSANRAKVGNNYHEAIRFVGNSYVGAKSRLAVGLAPNPPIPDDDAGWIALLNPENEEAPGGGPAYVSGPGDADTGAIGIVTAGNFSAGTGQVQITRPAYGDFSGAQSATVTASSF